MNEYEVRARTQKLKGAFLYFNIQGYKSELALSFGFYHKYCSFGLAWIVLPEQEVLIQKLPLA